MLSSDTARLGQSASRTFDFLSKLDVFESCRVIPAGWNMRLTPRACARCWRALSADAWRWLRSRRLLRGAKGPRCAEAAAAAPDGSA